VPALPFLDPAIPSTAGVPFLESSETEFERVSRRGAPNGYAPLGSDAKVPIANLPEFDLSGYQQTSQKNSANGYAGLGADGKISLNQLPDANALESEAIAYAIALG